MIQLLPITLLSLFLFTSVVAIRVEYSKSVVFFIFIVILPFIAKIDVKTFDWYNFLLNDTRNPGAHELDKREAMEFQETT